MTKIPFKWPICGPDFNRWYKDAAGLMALIHRFPRMWLCDSQLKYLDIRIDTRDGSFVVHDRDRKRISPDQILVAIRKAEGIFGEV